MDQVVSRSMGTRRFVLFMIGSFGIVSMGLALMGVYAVTAFSVRQRTREIGLRIALGASRVQASAVILRQGLSLTAWGLAGGALGAILLTRFLSVFLYGATPTDAMTFVCVSGILITSAFLACFASQTSRASRSDHRASRGIKRFID